MGHEYRLEGGEIWMYHINVERVRKRVQRWGEGREKGTGYGECVVKGRGTRARKGVGWRRREDGERRKKERKRCGPRGEY